MSGPLTVPLPLPAAQGTTQPAAPTVALEQPTGLVGFVAWSAWWHCPPGTGPSLTRLLLAFGCHPPICSCQARTSGCMPSWMWQDDAAAELTTGLLGPASLCSLLLPAGARVRNVSGQTGAAQVATITPWQASLPGLAPILTLATTCTALPWWLQLQISSCSFPSSGQLALPALSHARVYLIDTLPTDTSTGIDPRTTAET